MRSFEVDKECFLFFLREYVLSTNEGTLEFRLSQLRFINAYHIIHAMHFSYKVVYEHVRAIKMSQVSVAVQSKSCRFSCWNKLEN